MTRKAFRGGTLAVHSEMMRVESVRDWMALPVLTMGKHVVTNAGLLEAPLGDARRLGVPDLPHLPTDEELAVTLPTVEIAGAVGNTLYRLPPPFGPAIRWLYGEAGRWHAAGRRLLPATYEFRIEADGSASLVPVPEQ